MVLWQLLVLCVAQTVVDNQVDNVNTYDVYLSLYDDIDCMFQREQLLVTTENCYANRYEKPTSTAASIGYAFSLTIVNFFNRTNSHGIANPRMINLYYYTDDCHTPQRLPDSQELRAPLQLVEGQCSGDLQTYILGTLHGKFSLRQRTVGETTRPCTGGPHVCSTIRLLHTHFFATHGCQGDPYRKLAYPVGNKKGVGPCLRYSNGTHFFSIDETNADTIYEYDYPHSPDCTENGVDCTNCVQMKSFQIQLAHCYPVRNTDSFIYRVDPDPTRIDDGPASSSGSLSLTTLLFALCLI